VSDKTISLFLNIRSSPQAMSNVAVAETMAIAIEFWKTAARFEVPVEVRIAQERITKPAKEMVPPKAIFSL
jgi:hypothetical protein